MTSRGLLGDSTRVLKAKPGKLDSKRHKPGFTNIFNVQTSNHEVIIDLSLATSFKKCNVIMT